MKTLRIFDSRESVASGWASMPGGVLLEISDEGGVGRKKDVPQSADLSIVSQKRCKKDEFFY